MFPKENDPSGGKVIQLSLRVFAYTTLIDPETWTREELRRWLSAVRTSL